MSILFGLTQAVTIATCAFFAAACYMGGFILATAWRFVRWLWRTVTGGAK